MKATEHIINIEKIENGFILSETVVFDGEINTRKKYYSVMDAVVTDVTEALKIANDYDDIPTSKEFPLGVY